MKLSRDMKFPTMWYLRPAKSQISLRKRAVWSEPLLVAWIFYECKATDLTPFGVCKLKRRLHRLVWVYTCQNATLLEITCRGSNVELLQKYASGTFFIVKKSVIAAAVSFDYIYAGHVKRLTFSLYISSNLSWNVWPAHEFKSFSS